MQVHSCFELWLQYIRKAPGPVIQQDIPLHFSSIHMYSLLTVMAIADWHIR